MKEERKAEAARTGEPRANFPVFMKLIVLLLVFSFIPFLVGSLIVVWNYDSSYQVILESVARESADQEFLRSWANDIRHDLRIRLGFFFLFFTLFIIVGTLASTKLLVRPLANFLSGVDKIAKGDYGARIAVRTSDEFAIFAERFNQMAQRLETTRRREEWISRMKSGLLALAAHQLRTPLTAMQWIFHNLQQGEYGKLSKKQKGAVDNGAISSRRMIRLIASLLDVTAIEEGRFGYDMAPLSLRQVVEESIKEHDLAAKTKGVILEFSAQDNLPPVAADQDKLRLAIDNLVSNAISYTPSGRGVALSLAAKRKGPGKIMLSLSVADQGIGMSKEEQQKLFTRFFRGKEAMKMHAEGSGLGLFITKNIVEGHGGAIAVESKKGKGSTFTVMLPVLQKDPPQEKGSEEFFLQP